jgi:salicylate hydroxylase
MKALNIAIIGAGMSGLATAIALRQYQFKVKLYERTADLDSPNSGVALTPDDLIHLNAIQPGIADQLKQVGSPLNTLILKQSNGETISPKPIQFEPQQGQPNLNLQWLHLQALLVSALPSETIHFNHHCVGFESQDEGVKLFFSGKKPVETDLIIGADGIHSIVRQMLVGDGFPNYTDRVSWRGVLPFEHEQLLPHTSTLFTAIDGRNFLLADVGGGYKFWSASAPSEDDFVHERMTTPKYRALARFADWAEPVSAIVEATSAGDLVEQPIYDRPPVFHQNQRNAVLLGNAAHSVTPTLRRGVNRVFEDAYDLAQCLAEAASTETALKMYENKRGSRIAMLLSDQTHAVSKERQLVGKLF